MSEYTLEDYNELAYEFAIRNTQVIKLLKEPLTDDSAKELRKYGINTKVYYCTGFSNDPDAKEGYENNLRELNLDYYHLEKLKHKPYTYVELDIEIEKFKGYKTLEHPERSIMLEDTYKENDIEALDRIKKLLGKYSEKIETQIDSRTLTRCMDKRVFDNYDQNKLGGSYYDLSNNLSPEKKTIKADIKLVEKWYNPSYYLQLIHLRYPAI